MHPVNSNEISFILAAPNAFKEAFRNAGPKIMEPIYNVEIMTPADYMGACMSDLQNKRALIEGMSSDKGFSVLRGPCSARCFTATPQPSAVDLRRRDIHHGVR